MSRLVSYLMNRDYFREPGDQSHSEQNVWTLAWDLGQEETDTVPETLEH